MSNSSYAKDGASDFNDALAQLRLSETPKDILYRMLSLQPQIEIPEKAIKTSPADKGHAADGKPTSFPFLGAGACGEIFAIPGETRILKRALPGYENDLLVDFKVHNKVHTVFMSTINLFESGTMRIQVPEPFHHRLASDGEWWGENGQMFPSTKKTPVPKEYRSVLEAERILPLPMAVRLCLIEEFCHKSLKSAALVDPQLDSTLARVYLGSRRPHTLNTDHFRVHNFKLSLDKIDRLGLPKLKYAHAIAQGLAIIHWEAKVDGRDIEFVLGSSPLKMKPYIEKLGDTPKDSEQYIKRKTHQQPVSMWVLDFNQCRAMSMDTEGCRQASNAFWDNDPYYPRPHNTADSSLWEEFENTYLETAAKVLAQKNPLFKDLPSQFIEIVKARSKLQFPDGTHFLPPPKAAGPAPSGEGRRISAGLRSIAERIRKGKERKAADGEHQVHLEDLLESQD